MDTALIIILIVTGNLALYWLFFGRKKFYEKYGKYLQEDHPDFNKNYHQKENCCHFVKDDKKDNKMKKAEKKRKDDS